MPTNAINWEATFESKSDYSQLRRHPYFSATKKRGLFNKNRGTIALNILNTLQRNGIAGLHNLVKLNYWLYAENSKIVKLY